MNEELRRLMVSMLQRKSKQILNLYVAMPDLIESMSKTKGTIECLLGGADVMSHNPHNGGISFKEYDKVSRDFDRILGEYQEMIKRTLNSMQVYNTQEIKQLEKRLIISEQQK